MLIPVADFEFVLGRYECLSTAAEHTDENFTRAC